MAKQAVNSMTSAMAGEVISRVFSRLIQRYGKHATTADKLQQLEMLLIKIHSAIEASEKHIIENSWLLQWRDKLADAAKQGDEELASFQQRFKDVQETSNTDGNALQDEAASAAAPPITAVSALSFTRNSVSSMMQGIRSAREMLFSSDDDDIERLNKVVGRLLHFQALPKVWQRPGTTAFPTKVHGPTKKISKMREKTARRSISGGYCFPDELPTEEKIVKETSAQCLEEEESEHFNSKCDPAHLQEGQQGAPLQDRLKAAFAEICKAVELADSRDIEGLEWLAYWAGILREAKEQGSTVLGAISACMDDKELMVGCDPEKDELSGFVHGLESLARDVGDFSKLVYLFPAC
ncbi:hypothetical protein BRADI_1g03681v3 [Brachypodium distachyon]|uniref:Rx N-terminal domain-containing protein n=1 Tax=Brachypodium distachyon TaxID=15368 RepID=A0A0Q3JJP7_BRADI|nr:hypothetical protein BRADI_1g03681v3 [Brachypodium distachyon]